MYMINYYIAPDYQKIVRDIIFHMYLISVHIETRVLEGPKMRLFFYKRNFNYALSLKTAVRRMHEEVIRAARIGLGRFFASTDWKKSQSHNGEDPSPTPQHQANTSDIHQPYQQAHPQQVYSLLPPVCCVLLLYVFFFNAFVWRIRLIRVVNFSFDISPIHMPNIKSSFILTPGNL